MRQRPSEPVGSSSPDSALHAQQAGFGDTAFCPDVYDKAAGLACRIAWNHPLPDGNKRAALACLVLFIDLNNGSWNDEQPDTDKTVEAMLAVAARVDETSLANCFGPGHLRT